MDYSQIQTPSSERSLADQAIAVTQSSQEFRIKFVGFPWSIAHICGKHSVGRVIVRVSKSLIVSFVQYVKNCD
jgi:hypothetical protein